MNTLLGLLEHLNPGGLIPEVGFERETFHGDQSQRLTARVLWLRIEVKTSVSVPWGRGWDPR